MKKLILPSILVLALFITVGTLAVKEVRDSQPKIVICEDDDLYRRVIVSGGLAELKG